jgi:hypothetical protein
VTWADGLGAWEDGYNSGALRKASDAGLVDMTEIRRNLAFKPIPEGPIVLRKSLPEDVKIKMTALMASLPSLDPDCAYGVAGRRNAKGLQPINHDGLCLDRRSPQVEERSKRCAARTRAVTASVFSGGALTPGSPYKNKGPDDAADLDLLAARIRARSRRKKVLIRR